MEQKTQSLGLWLSLYCVVSIISGVGLFIFALIGLKNLADAPDGLGFIVFLFFMTAFINFFLVYRLMAVKNVTTIYLVRGFEALNIFLTLFAISLAGPQTIVYLLIRSAWLLYFFKSQKVKEIYFHTPPTALSHDA
ncbi:MAG: hypothetical protein Q4G44_01535 [Alcaligenaceae bacterium]|nr:hypothetical protein [Alcaligenaceae bacterium]